MTESERELQEARHKILGFMREPRSYSLEQYERQKNQVTVQRLSQETGLETKMTEQALASLVADRSLKQVLGKPED